MTIKQRVEGEQPPRESEDLLPPAPAPLVIPQGVQLVLLAIGLLALWVAARAAREVVLIFVVASLIALVLNPFVDFLHRRGLPRGFAIPLTYLSLVVVLAAVGAALAQPISHQISSFQRSLPGLVREANNRIDSVQTFLNKQGVHVTLRKQGQTALQSLQAKIIKGSSSLVSFTTSLLTSAANAVISLVLIFVISVYLLVYAGDIGTLARRVQRAVSGYVRAQLAFSVIMGTTTGIALWLFGVTGVFHDGRPYAFAFGAFFGVMELVPFVGPILGAIPPVVVALFQDPLSAVWVVILFIAIQQLEGHVVAPQIFGHALRINPLLVILALLFGDAIYGLIGALVALPVAAVLRETIVYLRRHVVLEPWRLPPNP